MKNNISTIEINSTKVGIYEMPSLQAAFIDIRFVAGSLFEKPHEWGNLHMLEHMLFNKSKNFRTRQELEYYKEENGITNNGWTGPLEMGFWFKFPYMKLKETVHLLEEMLYYPHFTEEDLKREKSIINQEHIDKFSSPYQRFHMAKKRQLYGDIHPYIRDGIGLMENIKDTSLKQIKNMHEKYIVSANSLMAYAGKSSAKEIQDEFNSVLNSVKVGKRVLEKVSAPQPEMTYLWHKEDVDQVQLHLNWHFPGREKLSLEERIKFNMAMYILGGSGRSKLYNRLRHELGLVYGISSSFSWWEKVSLMEIETSTSIKNVHQVKNEILSQVDEFINEPIEKETFERARNFMNIQTMMRYDSVGSTAESMANSLVYEDRIIPAEEYIEMANKFEEAEIRNLLKLGVKKAVSPFISVMSKEDPKLS